MITIVKTFTFDSAHYLPGYEGPCKNMHGHTYKLEIGITGHVNEKTGMVLDFAELKKLVKEKIVDVMDHTLLNECEELKKLDFPSHNPTAENMVSWLQLQLQPLVYLCCRKSNVTVTLIRLWETPTSYAEWRV